MEKMIKMRENFFFTNICAEIEPRYINSSITSRPIDSIEKLDPETIYTPDFISEFNDQLRAYGLDTSGTLNGWGLMDNCPACPCEDVPGRYHYVCHC